MYMLAAILSNMIENSPLRTELNLLELSLPQ